MNNKGTSIRRSVKPVKRISSGIDIHRDFACVSILARSTSGDAYLDYRRFDTTSDQMRLMRDWLLGCGVSVVGIESTGKYWYSVFNALEGHLDVKVYNARHIKNLPGKKTDKSDSRWIAKVAMDETIRPSYIPDSQIRDARMLSRYRKSLIRERTRVRQQVHGLLESAGIKINKLVSDLFGTSGRNLLDLIVSGRQYNEQIIEKMVRNQIRRKVPQLMLALEGYIRPLQRETLSQLLISNDEHTAKIKSVEQCLKSHLLDTPEKIARFERVCQLPGFSEISALILLSEVGFDLSVFPTSKHFCSWAGLCPGSQESAGKNKSGKIQTRQKYLRGLMIEIALISVTRKDTYLRAKYFQLKSRIGASKSAVAIAHKLLQAVYRTLKDNKEYRELGADYVSMSQMTKDLKTLTRISSRLGKDAVMAYMEQISPQPNE